MPPTIKILTTNNSNFVQVAQAVLDNADQAIKQTAILPNRLTFLDQDTNRKLIIEGSGFQFSNNGPNVRPSDQSAIQPESVPANVHVSPTAGTVTKISLDVGLNHYATITGFSVALTTVAASLQNGTVESFLSLLGSVTGQDLTFIGNKGNDNLLGTYGEDTFIGGPGGDTFNGGFGGEDLVSYSNAAAGVHASLATPGTNTGDAKGDHYVSIEDLRGSGKGDLLVGNASGNILLGGLGNDTLKGGTGDDRLEGGRGADRLEGQAGGDTFVFNSPAEGGDKVVSFDALDKVGIKAPAFGVDFRHVDFAQGTAPKAHSSDAAFLYDTDDKKLLFDHDGTGPGAPVVVFTILGAGAVQANDLDLFV